MSELTKLIGLKDELESWLEESSKVIPSIGAVNSKLNEILNQLLPRSSKLLAKTKEVDPISGAPRYGVQHCQKIHILNEQFMRIKQNLESLVERAITDGAKDDLSAIASKETNEPAADSIYMSQTVFDTSLGYKDSSRLTQEEKTTLQRQEDIRNNIILDPLAPLKADLRKTVQDINSANHGVSEFAAVVATHRQDPRTTPEQLREALKFLHGLLQNICGHPDDEKLRLIRLQHPVVYEKCVRCTSALQLLHAAGFTIRCDKQEGDMITNSKDISKGNTSDRTEYVLGVHSEAGLLPTHDVVATVFRQAHELNLTTVAFLREPSVENIPQWVAWFDTLTAVTKACGSEVQK